MVANQSVEFQAPGQGQGGEAREVDAWDARSIVASDDRLSLVGEVERIERDPLAQCGHSDEHGLSAGAHEFQITGRNSRGEGEPSEIIRIEVAAAKAA